MTRPDGGDGDGEGKARGSEQEGFDDVWGALVDKASAQPERVGGTKMWTDDVRAERKQPPKADEVEEVASEGTSATKTWTDEARGERKRDAPTPSPSPSPSASSSALLGPDPGRLRATAEDEMARLMAPRSTDADESATAKGKTEIAVIESATAKGKTEAAVIDVRPAMAQRREPRSARAVEDVRERVTRRESAEEIEAASDPEEPSANRTALWVAGVAAVAIAGYLIFGRGDDAKPADEAVPVVAAKTAKTEAKAKPSSTKTTKDGALASARKPEDDEIDEPVPTDTPAKAVDTKVEPDDEDDAATPAKANAVPDTSPRPATADTELKRDGDPREVPPGTSPANAAAFRKLPIAPGDRPPLGAIGLDGVHVDRIGVGSTFERSRCRGDTGEFSVSGHELVNVCIRIVHNRVKEDLIVLWQKDGGTVRRGKFVVPAAHAYRTRAYLVLRNEYVGKWTVRILDQKGTELASHPFVVVE